MKKIQVKWFLALAIVMGVGAGITFTALQADACEKCKVKDRDPKDRVCGSCNKKGMTKNGSEVKEGYWHVSYKCDHCGHIHIVKTKNMYEI